MRGWKILSKSLLRMPVEGMAAWISAGLGKLCWPIGRGVETLLGTPGFDLSQVMQRQGDGRNNCEPLKETPPSGVPARRGIGLPDRDPWGVPPREDASGALSLSFLDFPPSLISPPEAAPPSMSLPEPTPPGPRFRLRFLFALSKFDRSESLFERHLTQCLPLA